MIQKLTPNLNQSTKSAINLLKSANNPQAMLSYLSAQNPAIKQTLDYVNANGGDPRSAFYKLAQERGVDPNSILNMLK